MSLPLSEHWTTLPCRPVRSLRAGQVVDGRPELVLLPGLGAVGYLLPLLRACAAWTRVHLVDLPGFGHRATARQPADLASVVGAAAAWLAQVPTGPVVLLGHSTAGQVALHVGRDRPGEPWGGLGGLVGVVAAGVTFPPELRRLPPLAAAVLRTLPHERPGELPAVLPSYLRGARRMPVLLRTALADRPEQVAAGLGAPLLVLRGEQDRLCPRAWADRLAGRAPDGTLRELPGAHNTPWTHPAETSAAVQEWLARTADPFPSTR